MDVYRRESVGVSTDHVVGSPDVDDPGADVPDVVARVVVAPDVVAPDVAAPDVAAPDVAAPDAAAPDVGLQRDVRRVTYRLADVVVGACVMAYDLVVLHS